MLHIVHALIPGYSSILLCLLKTRNAPQVRAALTGGVNATRLCPDYVWTSMPACFTTSQVDLKHSAGVEHALDLALLVKVEVRSADGEPDIGHF